MFESITSTRRKEKIDQWKGSIQSKNQTGCNIILVKERIHKTQGLSQKIPVKQLRKINSMNYCVSEKKITIIEAPLWQQA